MSNTIIDEIVETLKNLYNAKKNKKHTLFCEYVEKVYNMTEDIYNDFLKIFYEAKKRIKYDEASAKEIIEYLDFSRLPFKSNRAKLKSILGCEYYVEDMELYIFSTLVLGVLQGGVHWKDEIAYLAGRTPIRMTNGYCRNLREYHTIVDIIKKYEIISAYKEQRLSNEEVQANISILERYGNSSISIEERMLKDIETQVDDINRSWERISVKYMELRYQKLG